MAKQLPNDSRVSRHWEPRVEAIADDKHTTPPITREIVEAAGMLVRSGNFRYVARQSLGLPGNIWENWILRGNREIDNYCAGKRQTVTLYGLFVVELDHAEADVHAKIVRDIMAPDTPINAKLWYLERRYNKLYSRNPNAHIDDESGKTIEIDVEQVLIERLQALIGGGDGGAIDVDR